MTAGSANVPPADLPDGLSGDMSVQPHLQKYSASRLTQINSISPAVPSLRGALAIVTDVGRDAVDAGSALDERCCSVRRSRVVLTPRCWRQVCDKKRR
jgi:hypothetical protein